MNKWKLWSAVVAACASISCTPTQINQAMTDYSFKCTEVGTSSSVGPYTKLSGVPFSLDAVVLYKGAETTLDSSASTITTTMDLVETTDNTTCESGVASISDSSVYSVPFSTTGRQTISGISVSNAHKTLMCRANMVYNGTTYRKCAGVTFAVRPAYLAVTSTNANADSLGLSTTATPTYKASVSGSAGASGTQFNLTATAKGATGTTLTNYDGAINLSNSYVAAHLGAVRAGTVAPTSFSSASSGVASSNFTYSEVGYFKLLSGGVTDSTYTSTDNSNGRCIAGSSSNVMSSGKYGCNIANATDSSYFGRFVPYTFKTSLDTTTQSCSAGANAYTYLGGEFTTKFNIEAANDSSSTTASVYRTQNYSGSFAKFATSSIGTTYSNYNFSLLPVLSGISLSQGSTAPVINTAWSSGTAVVTATHKATRPTSVLAPSSVVVQAQPTDTEATSTAGTTLSSALSMRLGRLKFNNAYGAETMALRVSVFSQYWNGTTWVTNSDDSCSVLAANSIYLNFPSSSRNNLSQCETTVTALNSSNKFNTGVAKYEFSAPGHGNNGWLTMSVNLGLTTTVSKLTCSLLNVPSPAVVANLTQFLDTVLGEQSATVSFGQYKSSVIYNREQ